LPSALLAVVPVAKPESLGLTSARLEAANHRYASPPFVLTEIVRRATTARAKAPSTKPDKNAAILSPSSLSLSEVVNHHEEGRSTGNLGP
jgi:hypothetical protein